MIWQTYHLPEQACQAFTEEPYRPFDLSDLGHDVWTRDQLCEYAAMRHLHVCPKLDDDSFIGFTSINQGVADDNVTLRFQSKQEIVEALADHDVLVWAYNEFFGSNGRRLTVAEASERIHPGINAELYLLLKRAGLREVPACYNHGFGMLAHNYWCMSRPLFAEYMQWSLPLVEHCLTRRDGFFDRWPRATSYLHERLPMCWFEVKNLRIKLYHTPHIGNADAAREIEKQRMIARGKEWLP